MESFFLWVVFYWEELSRHFFLFNPNHVIINPKLAIELASYGVTSTEGMVPKDLFNWENLLTVKGLILMVVVAFL
jgi:hypothetical protein